MVRIDPQRLMCLAVLLKHGSFRRAADVLGLTQPALSQSIAQLEAESGVKLVERTAHGVEPTIFGAALYAHARTIDSELTQAARRIQELRAGDQGAATIGASLGAATYLVAQAVCRMQASWPASDVRVIEKTTTDALIRRLHERSLDILVCQRPPEYELRGAKSLPLFYSRRLLCVRPGHPLGRCNDLRDMIDYPLVCPIDELGLLSDITRIFANEGLEIPTHNLTVSNSITLAKEVVKSSNTYGIFSDLSVWRERETGELNATELSEEAGQWYNVVTRSEHVGGRATKRFLQALFAVCETWGITVSTDARRLERSIPQGEVC